jgi:leucyl aminopeptidase
MQVVLKKESLGKSTRDALFLPVLEGGMPKPEGLAAEDAKALQAGLRQLGFTGRQEQAFLLPLPSGLKAAVAGLGKKEKLELDQLRRDLTQACRMLSETATEIAMDAYFPGASKADAVRAAAEAAIMGLYRYDRHKSERKPIRLARLIIAGVADAERAKLERAVEEGIVFGEQNSKAREWVNTPAAIATPDYMAGKALEVAKANGLKCTVLGPKEMRAKGMHAVLAVGSGSQAEPRLVILEYRGGKPGEKPICLVGKGVCFDSGGLSLKSASGMETMKEDKAGATAVILALEGCARLKLPRNVTAIAPLVENMPSGSAYHPGDIITSMSGKTIEVLNTDAEGRVILSDALHYATTLKPAAIIDIATLTGAAVVALGGFISAVMGTDPELVSRLRDAGERTHERLWELPMYDDYMDYLKSDVADVKNVTSNNAPNPAGSIVGGKFLQQFVGDTPWAHLDVAGPSWTEQPAGYLSKGASGVGVRLLLQLIKDWSG